MAERAAVARSATLRCCRFDTFCHVQARRFSMASLPHALNDRFIP
jgi:hypothetical protein